MSWSWQGGRILTSAKPRPIIPPCGACTDEIPQRDTLGKVRFQYFTKFNLFVEEKEKEREPIATTIPML